MTSFRFKAAVVLAIFLVSVDTGAARAPTDNKRSSAIQFGGTPTFVLSLNSFCTRDNDIVGCQTGLFTAGFQLDAHYRFPSQRLGLGLVGGAHFEVNGAETCTSDQGCFEMPNAAVWRTAAESRFYPLVRSKVELWLALEGGVVGAGGGRAFTDVGGEVGLGLGLDVRLTRYLLIGFDFRALFYGFGKSPVTPPDGDKLLMTNSVWFSHGLIKLSARFSL